MSKSEKLFSVAGTARHNGQVKVRFANDLVARIKILQKAGCTDINLVQLPKEMTKLEALQYLTEQGVVAGDEGFAVATKLSEKTKVARRGEVKVAAGSVRTAGSKSPKSDAKVSTEVANEEAE